MKWKFSQHHLKNWANITLLYTYVKHKCEENNGVILELGMPVLVYSSQHEIKQECSFTEKTQTGVIISTNLGLLLLLWLHHVMPQQNSNHMLIFPSELHSSLITFFKTLYELVVLMQENICWHSWTEMEGRVCGSSQHSVFSLDKVGHNTLLCLLEYPKTSYIHRCKENQIFNVHCDANGERTRHQSSNAGKMHNFFFSITLTTHTDNLKFFKKWQISVAC